MLRDFVCRTYVARRLIFTIVVFLLSTPIPTTATAYTAKEYLDSVGSIHSSASSGFVRGLYNGIIFMQDYIISDDSQKLFCVEEGLEIRFEDSGFVKIVEEETKRDAKLNNMHVIFSIASGLMATLPCPTKNDTKSSGCILEKLYGEVYINIFEDREYGYEIGYVHQASFDVPNQPQGSLLAMIVSGERDGSLKLEDHEREPIRFDKNLQFNPDPEDNCPAANFQAKNKGYTLVVDGVARGVIEGRLPK